MYGFRCWGGVAYGNSKGEKEGSPAWDNTYQLTLYISPICFMVTFGGLMYGDGKAVLFELECRSVL